MVYASDDWYRVDSVFVYSCWKNGTPLFLLLQFCAVVLECVGIRALTSAIAYSHKRNVNNE
jgi:hypothetical protein